MVGAAGLRQVLVYTASYTPFGVRCFGTQAIQLEWAERIMQQSFYTPFGVRYFGTDDVRYGMFVIDR